MGYLAFAKVYEKKDLGDMIGWDLSYDLLTSQMWHEMKIESPLLCVVHTSTPII
jgi:hypothetical protein